jgi:hypothetical protein
MDAIQSDWVTLPIFPWADMMLTSSEH